MSSTKKNKITLRKEYIYIFIIIFIISLLKIHFGTYEDEEMLFLYSLITSKNPTSTLLSKNWAFIQFSSTLSFFIGALFKNSQHLLIIYRIIGLTITYIVSLAFFSFLKNRLNLASKQSTFASICFVLAAPTNVYALGHSHLLMIFYILFVICLCDYYVTKKINSLILGSIFYCLSIIGYPSLMITFPIILFCLYKNSINKKHVLVFSLICILSFFIYLSIFIFNNKNIKSIEDFVYLLSTMLSFAPNGINHKISNLLYDIQRLFVLLLALSPVLFTLRIIKKYSVENYLHLMLIILFTCLPIILLILHKGSNQSGACLLVVYLIYEYFYYRKSKNDVLSIFIFLYLLVFLSCMLFTNQYIDSNSRYVLPAVITCLAYKYDNNNLGKICLISLLFFSVFSTTIYVVNDSSRTTFIYDCEKTIEHYPLKGIKVDNNKYQQYALTHNIKTKSNNITYISKNVNASFYLQNINKNICDPLSYNIQYDESYVKYFEYNKIKEISIVVEKEKFNDFSHFSLECEFGQYIANTWNYTISDIDEHFFIIEAKKK